MSILDITPYCMKCRKQIKKGPVMCSKNPSKFQHFTCWLKFWIRIDYSKY